MSESDLAIVAALVFAWGALSARLERFDVTAPIVFVLAGLALTQGPLASLRFQPGEEMVKTTAEFTLVLMLFCDASRVGMRELRADLGLYARLLGIRAAADDRPGHAAGTGAAWDHGRLVRPAGRRGPGADRCRSGRGLAWPTVAG